MFKTKKTDSILEVGTGTGYQNMLDTFGWSGMTPAVTFTMMPINEDLSLFLPKLIAGYAGSWVDIMGYAYFFSFTAFLGIVT